MQHQPTFHQSLLEFHDSGVSLLPLWCSVEEEDDDRLDDRRNPRVS